MLIAEYRPGAPLGWHRDVPDFEDVVGVSLAGEGELEFRRYPPRSLRSDPPGGRIRIAIAPRSIYGITGTARREWQHAVVASRTLRYSVSHPENLPPAAVGRHAAIVKMAGPALPCRSSTGVRDSLTPRRASADLMLIRRWRFFFANALRPRP